MDINSLRDAMNKYMMGVGRPSTATPIDPISGQPTAPPQVRDLSTISNLRALLGIGQGGQVPTTLAGPQGSVPRQAMDINELKRQYQLAVESGDDAKLRMLEEQIRQYQNPGQVELPPQGGPIGI